MKIQGISKFSFGRALDMKEAQEYAETLAQAKKVIGQTGKSVLIVHDACLPQNPNRNTGVANLAGSDSAKFFEFAKKYWGINSVEVLPQGQVKAHDNRYGAYSGTSLSLGNHQINLELLQTPEYENLISEQEFQSVVRANNTDKDTVVNWRNVMDNDSPHDKTLRNAFERFQNLPETSKLKQDYIEYCKQNNEWLEPKSIYETLSKRYGTTDTRRWSNPVDQNLYSLSQDERSLRIGEILKDSPQEANFYKFKQFLADNHLQKGKEQLNNMGLKLYGDFPLGFTRDEIWAFPNAFKRDFNMGLPFWNMASINYDTILEEGSEANKLLQLKLSLYARRYDSLRVDSAWNYIKPIMTPASEKSLANSTRKNFGTTLLDYMENALKKLKGESFSPSDLIYEFEAGPEEFSMWENGRLLPAVENRTKALNTVYMKSVNGDNWGSYSAYSQKGLQPFSLGIGNHDSQPLRQIANDIPEIFHVDNQEFKINHKADAIPVLSQELGISEAALKKPEEFAKAKWAEALLGKDNHMFYADAFGMQERFNDFKLKSHRFFGLKIPSNYEDAYIRSVQEGYGFNPMDAMEKLFMAGGHDKKHSMLFEKIQKFKNILLETKNDITAPLTTSTSAKPKSPKALAVIGITLAFGILGGILYKNKTNTTNYSDKYEKQSENTVEF